eukprot:scaffold5157_cov100-Cylindrotheca_fusiformis.AAC.18
MTRRQHERNTRRLGDFVQKGSSIAENGAISEFQSYWKKRLDSSSQCQLHENSAILQCEQERTIVVKLLRMLDASQQVHNERLSERLQLRKVLRMLNKARRVKLNMFHAHRKSVEKLRQGKEADLQSLKRRWKRILKGSKDLCDKYAEQNARLQQTISALKLQSTRQSEQWRFLEIENREKFLEEKVELERKVKESQQLQKHEKKKLQFELDTMKKKYEDIESQLSSRAKTFEIERSHQAKELKNATTRAGEYLAKLQELQINFDSLRSAHTGSIEDLLKRSEADRKKQSRETETLETQLEEIRRGYSRLRNTMEALASNHERQMAEKRLQDEAVAEEKRLLERENRILKAELEESRLQNSLIKSEMEKMKLIHDREMVKKTSAMQEIRNEKAGLDKVKEAWKQELEGTRATLSQTPLMEGATCIGGIVEEKASRDELIIETEGLESEEIMLRKQREKVQPSHSQVHSEIANTSDNHKRKIEEIGAVQLELHEEKESSLSGSQVSREELRQKQSSYFETQSGLALPIDGMGTEELSYDNELSRLRRRKSPNTVQQQSLYDDEHSTMQRKSHAGKETKRHENAKTLAEQKGKPLHADDVEARLRGSTRKYELHRKRIWAGNELALPQVEKVTNPNSLPTSFHTGIVADVSKLQGSSVTPSEDGNVVCLEDGQAAKEKPAVLSSPDRTEISVFDGVAQESQAILFDSQNSVDAIPTGGNKNSSENRQLSEDGIYLDPDSVSGYHCLETNCEMDEIAKAIGEEGRTLCESENVEVGEWRTRCHLLEHDRSDLARVTNVSWEMDKLSFVLAPLLTKKSSLVVGNIDNVSSQRSSQSTLLCICQH